MVKPADSRAQTSSFGLTGTYWRGAIGLKLRHPRRTRTAGRDQDRRSAGRARQTRRRERARQRGCSPPMRDDYDAIGGGLEELELTAGTFRSLSAARGAR